MENRCADLNYLALKLSYIMKAQATMYMAMTQEAIELDGLAGGKAVRGWMRNLGHWRGLEMRRGHQAMGYPINMESIMRYWDNASTYGLQDEWDESGEFLPCDTKVCVPNISSCYHAQVFRSKHFWRWGHVFCDELHQSVAEGYHPDAIVVIPINLMKGDSCCEFRWMLPPEAKAPEQLVAKGDKTYASFWSNSTPLEGAKSCMMRAVRITGGYVNYMLGEMISVFGQQGELAARRAFRKAGWMRAQMLKEVHQKYGVSPSAYAFLSDFDHPLNCLGCMIIEEESEGLVRAQVTSCPLDTVWGSAQGRNGGAIYCEEIYSAMLSEYMPGATFELTKARSRGDLRCELIITG